MPGATTSPTTRTPPAIHPLRPPGGQSDQANPTPMAPPFYNRPHWAVTLAQRELDREVPLEIIQTPHPVQAQPLPLERETQPPQDGQFEDDV